MNKIKYTEEYKKKKRKQLDKIFSKNKGEQQMQKASNLLIQELRKAKAAPVGAISPDGKRKKNADGKWVPVEKKNRIKRFLDKIQ